MQLHDHYAKSDVTYEVLDVLEFTSQRRRMSVVVRDKASGSVRLLSKANPNPNPTPTPTPKQVRLLCKGADSVMLTLL